jgi:DNA-binding transcriptional MerR regulator
MAEQNATGLEDIRHLLDRFPEDETTVRGLIEQDPTFAALCREYHQTEEEVQRLRERLEQLDEELVTRIEGYAPI